MQGSSTQTVMDYTTVPAGLFIEGHLWTGQATTQTALCPQCGRVGVRSMEQNARLVIVHTGSANGDVLEGIDYCTLELH